jgi:predicted PurR-regulated permease PerM
MIGNIIVILVLLFFLLSAGDQMWVSLSHLCSPVIGRGTFMQIVYDMEKRLSGYLFVLTIINCCVGLIIGLGMFLIGMPNPVVWGVAAGLVNFVPYVGALTGEIIVTLVALFSFDDIGHALLAPLVYLSVAFIEGNFLTPMILGKQFTLSPVVIIISLLFWGIVWGVMGLFLAVPILMLTKILCENIPSLAPVAKVLEK